MSGAIVTLRESSILRIRLNRPDRRNAFDGEMIRRLAEAFAHAAEDRTARVVILEGDGSTFCGGADVEYMRGQGEKGEVENGAEAERMAAMFEAIADCPHPVVAAVQGAALGGGCGLVAAADIAVAASDALFGFPEVRLGIIPAVIAPFVLRKVRAGDARRYFLTGERFDAAEAWRMGLIQAVGGERGVETEVRALTEALLEGAPGAQVEVKRLLAALPRTPQQDVASLTSAWIARVRASSEAREGLTSFLERRRASWSSRGPEKR